MCNFHICENAFHNTTQVPKVNHADINENYQTLDKN